MKGKFVISIDFELIWGMLDQKNCGKYKENIRGGRKAILKILELFNKYDIHATWAVVGMLACNTVEELNKFSPQIKPKYNNYSVSSYNHIEEICDNDKELYFGGNLIKNILDLPNQEIASHTFSHYYCDELGADAVSFYEDLIASKKIMKEKFNVNVSSIILPRNQIKEEYVEIIKKVGFNCIRTNPSIYALTHNKLKTLLFKMIRIFDTYFPYFNYNCKNFTYGDSVGYTCASRFLRPYSLKFSLLEKLKINRIKNQMLYSAKKGKVFHLWFHPHNFGTYSDKMLEELELILKYYKHLEEKYDYSSYNMKELVIEYERYCK